MGGAGSTRWGGYQRKTLTESCTILDAQRIGDEAAIPLSSETPFELNSPGAETRSVLVRSRWGFGGNRWLIRCPKCQKPVRKIYLPPASTIWACRICHNLE